jgi:hypothetical protein
VFESRPAQFALPHFNFVTIPACFAGIYFF